MTQQHPITPPPELVQQWLAEYFGYNSSDELTGSERFLATRAAQWGADQAEANIGHKLQKAADQELEACCRELEYNFMLDSGSLRAARRPKPKSLKEEALEQLDGIRAVVRMTYGGDLVCDTIRRALEQLDD